MNPEMSYHYVTLYTEKTLKMINHGEHRVVQRKKLRTLKNLLVLCALRGEFL